MLVDVVGDITASDQPETDYGGRSATRSTPIGRSFTTCAVLGRNGVLSTRASSPRAALGPDAFHAASDILTRVARRKLPNRASL
jgi:hypothetical protein